MAGGSVVPSSQSLSDGSLQGALSAQKAALGLERCPWCGQPISRDKFLAIEAKIREEERKRLAAVEAGLRKEYADKQTGFRKKVQAEADQKVKASRAEADRRHQEEIKQLRQILAKEQEKVVLKERAEFNRQRGAYQKKVMELERQLQQKAAHEVGDGAELDLYEVLRAAFSGDQIKRIAKGQRGGDILYEVMHKREVCGRILIDSKNRQSWQNQFVTKLREDQVEARADHAILSTSVFPAGKRELSIEDGVIVASPGRVQHIVEILRAGMIKTHTLGLSGADRAGKMARLYEFITSEGYVQLSGEAVKLTEGILQVDVDEEQAHQRVWKKRGHLATRLKNALRDVDTEVSAILEGTNVSSQE